MTTFVIKGIRADANSPLDGKVPINKGLPRAPYLCLVFGEEESLPLKLGWGVAGERMRTLLEAAPEAGTQEAPVMNLVQFAQATGGTTTADVDGHIHAGLRSAPQTKTYKRFYDRTLLELQAKRDATTKAYELAVAEGRVRRPGPRTLEEKAAGDPGMPSTQAAIRLLAKRKAKAGGGRLNKPGPKPPNNRRVARRQGAKRRLTRLMIQAWAVGHAAMVPGVQMRAPEA